MSGLKNIVVAFALIGGLTVSGAVLSAPATPSMAPRMQEMPMPSEASETAKQDLCKAMRKLWEDHITYTRNYIVSALAKLGDKDAVAERLLKNQDDIGDAVKPFHGEEGGEKLSALLRDHIIVATEVVKAAMKDDKKALDKAQKKWRVNADEIAAFLSGANPHLDKAKLTDMLYKHLDYTTDEVVSRLKKDWKADIAAYDKGHEHMLMFADMLTEAIVKQHPDKFR